MMHNLRYYRSFKIVAVIMLQFLLVTMDSNLAIAQDGGPTQPEVQSFEPIGTNQMVDLFTGDFTYNIPLFNLPGPDGGYPINLAYHSGVRMEQEASWVGLGWNINVGTINRQVRNLPDDFGGSADDIIEITTDMRPNWRVGNSDKYSLEIIGIGTVSATSTIYYDNYKGIGYSRQIGLSLGGGLKRIPISGDIGYNLTLDSQEGISTSVTGGIGIRVGEDFRANASASTGFNSRTGWQRGLQYQLGLSTSSLLRPVRNHSIGAGSSISFAGGGNVSTMSVPNQMRGGNGAFSKGVGLNFVGFFFKKDRVFDFSFSRLKDKGKPVQYEGVGYMYYQKSNDDSYDLEEDNRLKDFSREGDGLIHKSTRRLGVPTQSYDIYSVTGQGIGNMFRPFRNEISTNVEPRDKSEYHGGDFGVEAALNNTPLNSRFGVTGSYNYAHTKSDFWPSGNTNALDNGYSSTRPSLSKAVYFQNYGEHTYDDLQGNYGSDISSESPVTFALEDDKGFFNITNKNVENSMNTIDMDLTRTERKRRAVGVEAFTNGDILELDKSATVLSEFDINYYTSPSSSGYNQSSMASYGDNIRDTRLSSHVGGYIATNGQGMRYVYGLSAYNNTQKDVVFTVEEQVSMLNDSKVNVPIDQNEIDYKHKGTNKFYQSREMSEFAHSYMLTSILGTDYVDSDGIEGPSEGDLGYWVKFNYALADSDMDWRTPYSEAIYDEGYENSFTDGKGSYSHGNKEIWYVATIETKTHIAEFNICEREDMYTPINEMEGGISNQKGYYKIDRIDLYSKSERYPGGVFNALAIPIKSCHFSYDYSLCQGIESNPGNTDNCGDVASNEGGKLTLKKCYFTYRNNQSGSTTPYEFEYNTTVNSQIVQYDRDAVDRWGNYQPNVNGSNLEYPYVDPYENVLDLNERVSLWSMSAIDMPSGGRYDIDYESDSYAYVQDEVAMHMFDIVSLDDRKAFITNGWTASQIDHEKDASHENRRVYFKLEHPIPTGTATSDIEKQMRDYILPEEYMYFKVKINVTKDSGSKEMVAGYGKVFSVNVDDSYADNGEYLWGYVELELMNIDGEITRYHPFTEVGARHIKYNHPALLYDNAPSADQDKLSKSDVKNVGWSLITVANDMKDLFTDFTTVLTGTNNDKRFDEIELGSSFIRLRTPDKIKYGGGHRVKQIEISDNWDAGSTSYGVVYDYNLYTDGNGFESSGVASYEPLIGGDEIPLRKPIEGWEEKQILAKTQAQTYTEEPGNESLFPSPIVGYREVRSMSLNTFNKSENPSSNVASYGGVSVNEFYTSKDYPVIQRVSSLKTDGTFRRKKLFIPALFVNIDRVRMAASQGYYIELNNMHGKLKGAREIELFKDDEGKEIVSSSVKYNYFDVVNNSDFNDAGEKLITRRLKNEVDIMISDVDPGDDTKSKIVIGTLATEVEFIPETRYFESKNINGSFGLNFEQIGPIPAFFPIPVFNMKVEKMGTVVTNKIVSKSGIVKSTEAYQKGSMAKTSNLVFDQYTGQPLLTSVRNGFGDNIYGYSIKAYEHYESTGPAYENIGVEEIGTPVAASYNASTGLQHITMVSDPGYFKGDVILAPPIYYPAVGYLDDITRDKHVCHYHQLSDLGDHILETPLELMGDYRYTVIRSGRRNLLGATVSSIVAKKDPTKNRTATNCTDWVGDASQLITLRTIDEVISIDAVELGSSWYKDTRQLSNVPSNWYDQRFYSKGMAGVNSSIRPYGYIDDRTQTEFGGLTTVDLENDGLMNNVRLFDWDHILADGVGCPSKWKQLSQVTLKNPSSSTVESKNVLGLYSSSLYGKSGTEPIAVAGNAKNTEIGFENFEEYETGGLNISDNATNNANFYTTVDASERLVEDRFDIRSASNNIGYIDVDVALINEYLTASTFPEVTVRLHFDGWNGEAEERLLKVPSGSITATYESAGVTKIDISNIPSLNIPNSNFRKWQGELFISKTIPDYPVGQPGVNLGVAVTDDVSHTGTKSLVVTSLTGSDFLQGRLTLNAGEKYQISGWCSTPENVYLLKNFDKMFYSQFTLEYFDFDGTLVSTEAFSERDIFDGTFIEDWQKFTVDFTLPVGAHYVSIKLPTANEVYSTELQGFVQKAYYDDIRIQPLDGGMQSYVYNQENQRLEATLDGNNYATFYYYDDEGNLFLVKKETSEGIITVQESRSFFQKN